MLWAVTSGNGFGASGVAKVARLNGLGRLGKAVKGFGVQEAQLKVRCSCRSLSAIKLPNDRRWSWASSGLNWSVVTWNMTSLDLVYPGRPPQQIMIQATPFSLPKVGIQTDNKEMLYPYA